MISSRTAVESKSNRNCKHRIRRCGARSVSCGGGALCVSDANDYLKLTNWSDGGKHAFARRPCITADPGSRAIRVTRGGHYVFYDHLAVCRCAAGGFRQRVRRRPAAGGEAETILEAGSAGGSQGTEGEGCAGQPAFSSDLFAVVRLEDDDLVWIEAKPASAVYRPNDASFFGLYRLSFF